MAVDTRHVEKVAAMAARPKVTKVAKEKVNRADRTIAVDMGNRKATRVKAIHAITAQTEVAVTMALVPTCVTTALHDTRVLVDETEDMTDLAAVGQVHTAITIAGPALVALAPTCGVTTTDDQDTDRAHATMIDVDQVVDPAHRVATAVDQDMDPAHVMTIDVAQVAVDPARKVATVVDQDMDPAHVTMIDVDQVVVDRAQRVVMVVDQGTAPAHVMMIDVDTVLMHAMEIVMTDMNATAIVDANTTDVAAPTATGTVIEMATVRAIDARNAPLPKQPKNVDFQRIVQLERSVFTNVTLSAAKGLADHALTCSNGDPSLRSG